MRLFVNNPSGFETEQTITGVGKTKKITNKIWYIAFYPAVDEGNYNAAGLNSDLEKIVYALADERPFHL